jgi:hypothetical protein
VTRRAVALVTVTDRDGRDAVDSEVEVHTLEDLYAACRDAPPSHVVRIVLRGAEGDVQLHFGSFIRRG